MGYSRAGFDVYCVDIADQPNNPFPFHKGDAIKALRDLLSGASVAFSTASGLVLLSLSDFAAVHMSPPCQMFTAYRRKGGGVGDGYPNLIPESRELAQQLSIPWVIENVHGAPLEDAVRLCGSSFGLDVRRHRFFESNISLTAPACDHSWQTPRFPAATNRTNLRSTVEVGVWRIPLQTQQDAMGIGWMTLRELSEAIPPSYTQLIGEQMLRDA